LDGMVGDLQGVRVKVGRQHGKEDDVDVDTSARHSSLAAYHPRDGGMVGAPSQASSQGPGQRS
jgi:hypothetical protein